MEPDSIGPRIKILGFIIINVIYFHYWKRDSDQRQGNEVVWHKTQGSHRLYVKLIRSYE